jgi:hypothetical protein
MKMKPVKGDVEQAILEWCNPPLPLHPAYSCNPWAALAPAMLLDYNNVGGVRWTSISELCIIEIYPLLAPHVNTINKYEACEGRCGTSHLGMVQPPPSTLHLYTAQSYAFKAMLIIITIIMILQKIVAPEQVKDKWRISSSSHIRQLPAHTWCAGTCTSLPAMRALPLLLPCICSCHASAPAMHLNGLQQCGWS